MKYLLPVTFLYWLGFAASIMAQDKPANEPTELITRRANYTNAIQRAVTPIMSAYVRSLEPLKQQYTREGKLEAALAVDNELKKIAQEMQAASQATAVTATGSSKPVIVSATYGEVKGDRKVDTTKHLQKIYESGVEGVKLTTRYGAGGVDPAQAQLKETTITYTVRGQTKTKIFPEGYDLNFKDDLK